jgi:two-component system, sensor histidine kinase and response regulator
MTELPGRDAQRSTELQDGKRRLELEVGDLDSFSNSIAHDLRAPLRAIGGYAAMLLEDHAPALGGGGADHLARIEANARKMANMIDGFLDFLRLGHAVPDATEIDTPVLVRSVVRELQEQTGDMKPAIHIDSLPPVRGDATMLRRAWSNLLSNAIKFSAQRAEPEIRICAERQGDEVVFSIRDNGVGFDMTYADQLFGVFNRLHAADEFPGVGVGLAIVRRIVFRHGGRTWARSEHDHGTTFYFSLPLPQ